MRRLVLILFLTLMAAACGNSHAVLPTELTAPPAIGGTWSGTFSTTSLGRTAAGPLDNTAVRLTVAIQQSARTAGAEFEAIRLQVQFSGELVGETYRGTTRLTGANGCMASAPF
jgi:hypothetical protein